MTVLSYLLLGIFSVVAGMALDALFGDPKWLYHPVRLIGKTISGTERLLRRVFSETPHGELAAGTVLAAVIPLGTLLTVSVPLWLAMALHPVLWLSVETLLMWILLAAKSLEVESCGVYTALSRSDTRGAREALSRIVGRDTQQLDEAGIIRAAVETVSENTVDGVVAPLFYTVIGGAALGWCYKSVNTLDSMVGYKNPRYLHFGRASARLDDVLNFIPSRIAALCMVAAAWLLKLKARGALRIWQRDNCCHASPNSAQTEAACAGALGIQLGGDAVYFGKTITKPTIGDNLRPPQPVDILLANRLMWVTAVVSAMGFILCKGVVLVVLWNM